MSDVSLGEWRLVQVFLASKLAAVFEVEMHLGNTSLRCTCPGFLRRRTCKHVGFVEERIDRTRGTYPMEVTRQVTPDDARKAEYSAETFRDFVLHFGKVEVL